MWTEKGTFGLVGLTKAHLWLCTCLRSPPSSPSANLTARAYVLHSHVLQCCPYLSTPHPSP